MKSSEKLFELIPKLGPVEFAGLAKLLGVKLYVEVNPDAEDLKEKYAPREFLDVLENIMKAFDKLGRSKKREILRLVEKATKNSIKSQVAPQMAAGPSAQTGEDA